MSDSKSTEEALHRLIVENRDESGHINLYDQKSMADEILQLFDQELQKKYQEGELNGKLSFVQSTIRVYEKAKPHGVEGVLKDLKRQETELKSQYQDKEEV